MITYFHSMVTKSYTFKCNMFCSLVCICIDILIACHAHSYLIAFITTNVYQELGWPFCNNTLHTTLFLMEYAKKEIIVKWKELGAVPRWQNWLSLNGFHLREHNILLPMQFLGACQLPYHANHEVITGHVGYAIRRYFNNFGNTFQFDTHR